MRLHLAALLTAAASLNAHATEPLHVFTASSVEIYATDDIESIDVEEIFVEFDVSDSPIFASALVFKDELNDYPQLLAFSEQFISTAYASSNNRIFSELEVQSEFANARLTGREYLIDAESGTCELLLGHAVGDSTYMFFTVIDPRGTARCVDAGRELRSIVTKVTASVAVAGH